MRIINQVDMRVIASRLRMLRVRILMDLEKILMPVRASVAGLHACQTLRQACFATVHLTCVPNIQHAHMKVASSRILTLQNVCVVPADRYAAQLFRHSVLRPLASVFLHF